MINLVKNSKTSTMAIGTNTNKDTLIIDINQEADHLKETEVGSKTIVETVKIIISTENSKFKASGN